jgi:hypothetical protein
MILKGYTIFYRLIGKTELHFQSLIYMDNRKLPNVKSFLTNLKVSMPVKKKIWLIIRNNAIKIFTLKNCCGHPGEPGC